MHEQEHTAGCGSGGGTHRHQKLGFSLHECDGSCVATGRSLQDGIKDQLSAGGSGIRVGAGSQQQWQLRTSKASTVPRLAAKSPRPSAVARPSRVMPCACSSAGSWVTEGAAEHTLPCSPCRIPQQSLNTESQQLLHTPGAWSAARRRWWTGKSWARVPPAARARSAGWPCRSRGGWHQTRGRPGSGSSSPAVGQGGRI